MKMKLAEVLNINQVLKSIIDNTNSQIDSLLKFKFLGIMKSMETPISNFEIIRNDKILEFGKETEDGNVRIDQEDKETMENFNKALSEILGSEVKVDIEKIKSDDIFNKGISAEYLMVLYPIIEA